MDHGQEKRLTTQSISIPRWAYLFALLFLNSCQPSADKPTDQLEVASVGIHAGALSTKGDFAVVGSLYHGASFWDTHRKERLFNWSHEANENATLIATDLTEDNQWAITADVTTLVLWNTNSGQGERYWQAPNEILSVKLAPDARFALLGLTDHTAVLFDIVNGGVLRTLHHSNRVRSVDMSNDGRYALTGSEDYQAIFWDLNSGNSLSKMQHDDDVQLVALSGDGTLAFSVSKYDKAVLWSTDGGRKLGELPLRAEAIKRGLRFTTARFSSDNQWLLTGRPDQIVSLWKVSTLEEVQRWRVPKRSAWKPQGASIIDVAFAEDPTQFFAMSSNGFIFILRKQEN